MRLVILGGTGSGKSTQTARLSEKLMIPFICSGEVLKIEINRGSDLGKKAKYYVEKGELVPDELTIQFIEQRLLKPDVSKGWILSGYPRTAFQAEELDFLLNRLQQKLDRAIYLKVSESVMKQRALGRASDGDISEVDRSLPDMRSVYRGLQGSSYIAVQPHIL